MLKRNVRRRRMAAAMTLTLAGGIGFRWLDADCLDPLPTGTPAYSRQVSLTGDGPNAAHFYAAAADSLTPDALNAADLAAAPPGERRRVVLSGAQTLRFLREGFAYRYRGRETRWLRQSSAPDPAGPVLSFVSARQMARLIAADASVKAADGASGAAMDAALDAVRFGQDIGGKPDTLVGAMIGQLCVGLGAEAARTDGRNGGSLTAALTAAEARRAARRLEALLQTSPTAAEGLQAERNYGIAELRQYLTPLQPFRPDSETVHPADYGTHLAAVLAVFRYGKQGTLAAYDRYMFDAVRRASLPYAVARRTPPAPVPSNPLVAWRVPNTERALWQYARNAARLRLLLTELALRAYREEHGGASPETLASLTQGANPYLKTVPADPFSPTGAAPLQYREGVVSSVAENLEQMPRAESRP